MTVHTEVSIFFEIVAVSFSMKRPTAWGNYEWNDASLASTLSRLRRANNTSHVRAESVGDLAEEESDVAVFAFQPVLFAVAGGGVRL